MQSWSETNALLHKYLRESQVLDDDPNWTPPPMSFPPKTRPRNLYLATTVYPDNTVTQNIFVASSTAAAYLHAATLLKTPFEIFDVEMFVTLERTLRPALEPA